MLEKDFKAFSQWWRPRRRCPRAPRLSAFLFLIAAVNGVQSAIVASPPPPSAIESRQPHSSEGTLFKAKDKNDHAKDSILLPSRPILVPSYTIFLDKGYSYIDDDWDNSVQVFVSEESWRSYLTFKEQTCRPDDDDNIAGRVLNSTENRYFSWEEKMFHMELRKLILPETKGGRFNSLIGTPLLRSLDPRFFASPPESLCKAQRDNSKETELAKLEHAEFEDFLINKLITPKSRSKFPPAAAKVSSSSISHGAVGSASSTPKTARLQGLLSSKNSSSILDPIATILALF